MGEDDRKWERGEIAFFGKVTASISHEINNVVTIVGEVGGLLEDMCALSEQGKPLDPERVARASQQVATQVARGKRIVKGLNRFAHSADADRQRAELNEFAERCASLFQRFAELRRTSIEAEPTAEPIEVTANLFCLHHLLFLLITDLLSRADGAQPLYIAPGTDAAGTLLDVGRDGIDGAAGDLPEGAADLAARAGFVLESTSGSGAGDGVNYRLRPA